MRGSVVPRSKALGALLDNIAARQRQAPAVQHTTRSSRQASPIYRAALRKLHTTPIPLASKSVTSKKSIELNGVPQINLSAAWPPATSQLRLLSTTSPNKGTRPSNSSQNSEDWKDRERREEEEEEAREGEEGFGRSEKASRAAQRKDSGAVRKPLGPPR
jgi:hypothetical protein